MSYTPGDEYVDPLIAHGEQLERLKANAGPHWLPIHEDELQSIKAIARARIAHTSQFPFASTSQEESAQYLAEQEARSAREREAAALKFVSQAWEALKPILLGLARDAIASGVKRLDLPPLLSPVSRVVEDGAKDAVAAALDDLKP